MMTRSTGIRSRLSVLDANSFMKLKVKEVCLNKPSYAKKSHQNSSVDYAIKIYIQANSVTLRAERIQ
jgi:hypothetical protein